MVIIKTLLTGLIAVSLCLADISGIVVNSGNIPIAGVSIKLEKGGRTATSGIDGRFTLANAAVLSGTSGLRNTLSARMHGNLLYVTNAEPSVVEVTTFNLNGKALSTVRQKVDAGTHIVALPFRGAGVYLYKIKSGTREFIIKGNAIGGGSASSPIAPSNTLAKQAKNKAGINDVIAATKTGYLKYRVGVTNPDTSGVEIKMIVCADTVRDADGNLYQAVRLGSQVWTAENLRVTKYSDGTAIPHVSDSAAWVDLKTPGYCWHRNTKNADSIIKYGALYNRYTVDTRKLSPSGWHVPSDSEWTVLEKFLVLNGYNWDKTTDTAESNKVAKSLASKTAWNTSASVGAIGNDLKMNNTTGFSANPSGGRGPNGEFDTIGSCCFWWSATDHGTVNGYCRALIYDYDGFPTGPMPKNCGFAVRLIRDPKKTFTITPFISNNIFGIIIPATPQFVDSGSASPVFIFKPKNHYRFDSLTIGGIRMSTVRETDTAYTIASVLRNDTIQAWFTKKTSFTIIPSINDPYLGFVTPFAPQAIDSGSASPVFIFKPKIHCRFDSLTLGGKRIAAVSTTDTAYSIPSVARNDTLKAWFSNKTCFVITPSIGGKGLGTIAPDTPQVVDSGAPSPVFIFKPRNYCRFDSLTLGGIRLSAIRVTDTAYTIAGVLRNDTIKAWFTKLESDPLVDIDGNVYKTVGIGDQLWMAENLRVTRYNDSTAILMLPDSAAWPVIGAPRYCYYKNTTDVDSIRKYGALYNWYVIEPTNPKKIAPAGWHVPDEVDWLILEEFLIRNGFNWDGSTDTNRVAKSLATKTDWRSDTTAGAVGNDLTKNNESGFSGLPSGRRFRDGSFTNQGSYGYWWVAENNGSNIPPTRSLSYGAGSLRRILGWESKGDGYSVRLVKDHAP